MKQVKKLAALVLALTLVTSMMAGCSKSDEKTSDTATKTEDTTVSTDTTTTEATTETASTYTGTGPITTEEGATLSFLATNSWYSTVDLSGDDSLIIKEVEKRAGVSIDWTMIDPTTYTDSVSPMLAAGTDLQDIVSLPDLDPNMTYINSGLFEPLDTHFDLMPNFVAYLDANPDVKASLTAQDGHIYYVPTIGLPDNYLPCLMYNVKWLEQLNMEAPTTLDTFVEMLKAFRDNDMNGNGDATDEIPMSVQAAFLPYMFGPAFGLDLVNGFYADEDGTVHYANYESDNYKKYLTFINSLYAEGLLEIEYTSLTRDQITERFAQNLTGVTFDYSWQMSQLYSKQFPEYDGETGIVVGAEPLSGEYPGAYVATNPVKWIFGVTSASENLDLAIKFLDFAMSEECQELYVWGIKDTSYTTNADGSNSFTEQALSDSIWLQTLGINPPCLPYHNSVPATNVLLPQWHVDVDTKLATMTRDPWPQIYATEEESNTIAQYLVDIQTYVDQMTVAFITGNTSLDEFDSYLSTLKNMNVEEIIKIKQAQYDRYSSAK